MTKSKTPAADEISSNYQQLGASASKAGLHKVLETTGLAASEELFAAVIPDPSGDPDYFSFVHADGAGTKSIVAYLHYRETGDPSCFAGLAQDALVMNIDDVYCVGTPQSLLLSNTMGRNSHLISDEVIGVIIARYKELASQLAELGIPLQLAGGETADCGDVIRTLMVDATVAGRIAAKNLIKASSIRPGDEIIGFSSTGQATYEQRENSGVGSNGLTLARHSLLTADYLARFPECCDPALPKHIAYRGPFKTTDNAPGLMMTVGEALASPTRTYAPILSEVFQVLGHDVHGAIHNTGGGQTKVLRFGSGNHYVKDSLFPCPPLFALVQKHGGVSWKEMHQVFNMGHRMEVYVPPARSSEVIGIAERFGIEAKKIGHVEAHSGGPAKNRLTIRSAFGEFEY